MSTISAGTTVGTALVQTGDTTGNLVIRTGANATTALTISGTDQSITVAGGLNLGAPVAVASGGTGANSASAARTNLGLAIGTDVLAPNGSGANLTSLNASSVSSGTLAVARGGTGITSVGTSGNVLTSNGSAWVSQALPAGGVTSLNGQTGAITNTDLYAIGSYITGRPANLTSITVNTTIAGSSLFNASVPTYYNNTWQGFGPAGQVLINTGTWRCMSPAASNGSDANSGLWVRIS